MEQEPLHSSPGGTVLYSPGIRATFFTAARRSFGPSPSLKKDTTTGTGDVALWGAQNNYPQVVTEWLNKSDVLRPLLRRMANKLIGQGLVYGTTEVDARGEQQFRVLDVPAIDAALEDTNHLLYLQESANDWFAHGNVFSELQMNGRGEVVGLFCQDANRCRLSRKDTQGRITRCYIDGEWPNRRDIRKETIDLPALDPYYRVADQVREASSGRLILPLRLLIDDLDYYGIAPWHGLITSGWLDVAEYIPKLKKSLMENLITIRYHIEISEDYWPHAYPGFIDKPADEKTKIKKDAIDAFSKWAAGVEASGRTLLTPMVADQIAKDYRSMWKVNQLKLEIPTGAYIEDSQEADFHIVRAFMDPTLFGIAPGKDRNSAGSGSDKRMANTHHVLDGFSDAHMLLTPFRLMADVNGWHQRFGQGKRIKFWFKSYHAATLDRTQGAITTNPANAQTT